MRPSILPLLGTLALLASCSRPETAGQPGQAPVGTIDGLPADAMPVVESARTAAKGFAGELKGTLEAAINADGAVGAIAVCSTRAPIIAAEHGQKLGGSIRRVSMRQRNPGNEPDDWEFAVLDNFANRLRAGTDPARLETATIEGTGSSRQLRYARAILTDTLCLTCHGETIIPPVQAKLAELYPEDRATGHKQGDLRGILSVTMPMPREQ